MRHWGIALIFCLLGSAASADSIDSIATWTAARPRPLGLTLFCREHPTWCSNLPETEALEATPDLKAQIAAVNVAVNHAITYRTDRPVSIPVTARPGESIMVGTWEIEPEYGDCEDYAVTKLSRLIASGLPRSALRIATLQLPSGAYHAVLTVETTEGTVVLNNLTDQVTPWREVDADWIGIERVSHLGFMGMWALND